MCDRLVRKRLISRTRDEVDRREVDLSLTNAGKALVDEVAHRRKSELRKLVGDVPKEERERLIDALRSVAEAAGDGSGRRLDARLDRELSRACSAGSGDEDGLHLAELPQPEICPARGRSRTACSHRTGARASRRPWR